MAASPEPRSAARPSRGHRSLLDRLNPVTRLLLATIVTLGLLLSLDWLSPSIVLAAELALAPSCGLALWPTLRRATPLLVAAALASLSTALYGQVGGTVHWHWGLATVSDTSIRLAVAIAVRVLALGGSAILLFTGVDATDLADGLGQVLRLPARLVLGSLAGFRMLNVFTDDWRSLAQARRARGLGDAHRVRRWATMAFALLVIAIRRGSRLATAMEVRGLGSGGVRRTWARPSRLGRADAVGVLVTLAVVVGALLAAVAAGTFWLVWS